MYYQSQVYWPPFPALVVMPLVAIFGIGVSDVIYTAVFTALSIALLAKLLQLLDYTGVAPLSIERRAIIVATMSFGSVLLIRAGRPCLAHGAGNRVDLRVASNNRWH